MVVRPLAPVRDQAEEVEVGGPGYDGLSFRFLRFLRERFEGCFELTNLVLLFLYGFDQQRNQAAVVNRPGIATVLLIRHDCWDHFTHLFSDQSNAMAAVLLPIKRGAAETLYFVERTLNWCDVC